MNEFRMISTSGLLGYGFPEASLKAGLTRDPHLIGVDGGSTDPGPYYLGSGKPVNSRIAMKRDISLMLAAAMSARIPLVIGSCGGAGGEPHLQLVVDIVRELAREHGQHFKMAVIHAEQPVDKVSVCTSKAGAAVAQCAGHRRGNDPPREPHRRHDGRRAVHARAR